MRLQSIALTLATLCSLSNTAIAATLVDVTYDYTGTWMDNGTSFTAHGSDGFTLYGTKAYVFNHKKQMFSAPSNQYLRYVKDNGTWYYLKYHFHNDNIVEESKHDGFNIAASIQVSGDSCSATIRYSKLPGKRTMLSEGDHRPFTVEPITAVRCNIRRTDWQPPQ